MIFDIHIGPKELSPSSRVWIYQASRLLNSNEVEIINRELSSFVPGWTAHDELLEAAGGIHKNLFVVLVADQSRTGASGCSIDKSLKLIQGLEQKLNVEFLNRTNVAFMTSNELEVCTAEEFKQLMNIGQVDDQTIVYNNLITEFSEMETNWEMPLGLSWHKNFFS